MNPGSLNMDTLLAWRGRHEQRTDCMTLAQADTLAATLDRSDRPAQEGDTLPPGYQWLYFLPVVAMSQVGEDGHPQRGSFLPPVPLPRRMWAAGRLRFHAPLLLGEAATRESEITDVRLKNGRSGPLVFVTVRHRYLRADGQLAIVEEQDIVYRNPAAREPPSSAAKAATASRDPASWRRSLTADPVLLFRYSALTFNGHRIHYDRPYSTEVEGYPGLVVHGPLIATLLLDLLRRERPEARVTQFEFRAMKPLYDGSEFQICGEPAADGRSVRLWSEDASGALCMAATAALA